MDDRSEEKDSVYGITYKRLWCTHCPGFPYEKRSDRERKEEKERERKTARERETLRERER